MEFSEKLYNKIRDPIITACIKLGLTANMITIFNHFITLTFGTWYFSRGTHLGYILGLVVCLINGFLDYLDGDIAKATGRCNKYGEWLDTGFDVVIQNAVMGAIALGCFKQGLNILWILIFFIGNSASNLVSFHFNATFGFQSATGNNLFRKIMNKKNTLFNRLMKNLIDPTASFAGLFFFTYRYFIVLGIIFNIMPKLFIVMTIISNIKWFIMFVLYGLHQKHSKKLYVLQALSALDDERMEFYKLRNI
jgi:phosphatidylglycerophosphate synthase